MKVYNDSGNLTLVLPVRCNAKCSFCVWDKKDRVDKSTWFYGLVNTLLNKEIMDKIHSISISGGEPTMDYANILDGVLNVIYQLANDKKVVLNTNGYNLYKAIHNSDYFTKVINHINISRHSANCTKNFNIFNTKSIITGAMIKNISSYFEKNKIPIDITINMVYNNDTNIEEFYKMIDFCKEHDVHALAMRQDIELGLERSLIDLEITDGRLSFENSCPVCKTVSTVYRNFPVIFKYGVRDTFLEIGNDIVYEFIYNESGILTYDWGGNVPYNESDFKEKIIKKPKDNVVSHETTCGSGCGSSGYGRSACGGGGRSIGGC